MHKSITIEKIEKIARNALYQISYEGLCIDCGYCQSGVEMDAFNILCERCGNDSVQGGEGLLLALI